MNSCFKLHAMQFNDQYLLANSISFNDQIMQGSILACNFPFSEELERNHFSIGMWKFRKSVGSLYHLGRPVSLSDCPCYVTNRLELNVCKYLIKMNTYENSV